MSDTSILPTSDADSAPVGVSVPDFDDDSGDDRRRLMLIGGGVVLVLVIVVAFLMLRGGGSSSDDLGAVPRGTPHSVASPAGGSDDHGNARADSDTAGSTLPKKSKRGLARDPFKALVRDEHTTTTGSGSSGVTTPAGSSSSAEPPAGGDDVAAGTPVAVRVVSVTASSAVFDVTYAKHQVFRFEVPAPEPGSIKGTVFAKVFSLLGIQGHEVTLQVGDDTPIDLKKGASHSV
jgi:hypothetical protein